MPETNPFRVFCPANARYLILGSFASKDGKAGVKYEWYYSNGRNHFWPMLEDIYGVELKNKTAQQRLFKKLSIAVADVIYQCTRQKHSSLDVHLTHLVYNIKPIARVLRRCPIEKILFTSRFVEKIYRKHFKDLITLYPQIKLITLPSPSPRYVLMTKKEKARKYRAVFRGLDK